MVLELYQLILRDAGSNPYLCGQNFKIIVPLVEVIIYNGIIQPKTRKC